MVQGYVGFRLYSGPDRYAPLLYEEDRARVTDAETMAESLYVEAINIHYCWDGHLMNQCGEQPLLEAKLTTSKAQLEATSNAGDRAAVNGLPWPEGPNRTYQNDVCQLTVNGRTVGEAFGCKRNFVTVEWHDVFGNGSEQLYVKAVSGYKDGLDHIPPTQFAGCPCMYQRLLLYAFEAGQARELANVVGCIDDPFLVGATLLDFDHDDQLEIIAGPSWERYGDCTETQQDLLCWHELHLGYTLYEWNRTRFSLRR